MQSLLENPAPLFNDYMRVIGRPDSPDASFQNKKLGVINSSAWMSLWSSYFGKMMLPGAHIVNVGNDAIQINFMQAHHDGKPTPPQRNIDLFCQFAEDLYELAHVDAILISCSTMNRAHNKVSERMQPHGVPVLQIDQALMEKAVTSGQKILIIATLQSTVQNTQSLLEETADRLDQSITFTGACVPQAFTALNNGDVDKHNNIIAAAIRATQAKGHIDMVVLAQLSMSIFLFTYPNPQKTFGIPVLTSGIAGFQRAGEILKRV